MDSSSRWQRRKTVETGAVDGKATSRSETGGGSDYSTRPVTPARRTEESGSCSGPGPLLASGQGFTFRLAANRWRRCRASMAMASPTLPRNRCCVCWRDFDLSAATSRVSERPRRRSHPQRRDMAEALRPRSPWRCPAITAGTAGSVPQPSVPARHPPAPPLRQLLDQPPASGDDRRDGTFPRPRPALRGALSRRRARVPQPVAPDCARKPSCRVRRGRGIFKGWTRCCLRGICASEADGDGPRSGDLSAPQAAVPSLGAKTHHDPASRLHCTTLAQVEARWSSST